MKIRAAQLSDSKAISELICGLTEKFIVRGFTSSGKDNLLKSMSPQAIKESLQSGYDYHVAEMDAQLVGVIAVKEQKHLYQLFVAERYHRQGIGRQLWQFAMDACLRHGSTGEFTVNSSVYAKGMYERLGFVAQSKSEEHMGVVYIPMKLIIDHKKLT